MRYNSHLMQVPNPCYLQRCLICFEVLEGTYKGEIPLNTFVHSSQESKRVNRIFQGDLAVDLELY